MSDTHLTIIYSADRHDRWGWRDGNYVEIDLGQLCYDDLPTLAKLAASCDGRIITPAGAYSHDPDRRGTFVGGLVIFPRTHYARLPIVIGTASALNAGQLPDRLGKKLARTRGLVCILDADGPHWGTWKRHQAPHEGQIAANTSLNNLLAREIGRVALGSTTSDIKVHLGTQLYDELGELCGWWRCPTNTVIHRIERSLRAIGIRWNLRKHDHGHGEAGWGNVIYSYSSDPDHYLVAGKNFGRVTGGYSTTSLAGDELDMYVALRDAGMTIEDATAATQLLGQDNLPDVCGPPNDQHDETCAGTPDPRRRRRTARRSRQPRSTH